MLVRVLIIGSCAQSHALHVRMGLAVQDRKGVVKKGIMDECIFDALVSRIYTYSSSISPTSSNANVLL